MYLERLFLLLFLKVSCTIIFGSARWREQAVCSVRLQWIMRRFTLSHNYNAKIIPPFYHCHLGLIVENSFVLVLCSSCQQTYTHTHTSVAIRVLSDLCFPELCQGQCISELCLPIFTQVHMPKCKIFSFFLTWEMAKSLVADLIPVTSAAFMVVFLKFCYYNW